MTPSVALVDNELLNSLIAKIEVMGIRFEQISKELNETKSPYMDTQAVMEYTGFKKTWVNDNKHKIGYRMVGGELRFKRKEVESFMEESNFNSRKK
ncbi:helix-turn-helix domain-containing protein [Pedobacter sp. PAMC26386]|nr:helix-turn-helix domain-containing protein [Pedobacter sp. PAMC26386]